MTNMALILAIEADKRQANLLATIGKQLGAELVIAATAESGLAAIDGRVPDLILTSALLSPADETVLATRLRELDDRAAHVQTLTTPVLAKTTRRPAPAAGLLGKLRGGAASSASPCGCDPSLFAAQISEYLARAAAERRADEGEPLDHPEVKAVPATEVEQADVTLHVDEPILPGGEPAVVALELIPEPHEETRAPEVPSEVSEEEIELADAFDDDDDTTEDVVELNARTLEAELELALKEFEIAAAPLTVDEPVEPVVTEMLVEPLPAELLVQPVEGIGDGSVVADEARDGEIWSALAWTATPWPALECDDIASFVDPAFAAYVEASSAASEPVPHVEAAQPEPQDLAHPVVEEPAVQQPAALDEAPLPAAPRRGAARRERKRPPRRGRPTEDEWGLFDPDQCGFAALLQKLDEISTSADDAA